MLTQVAATDASKEGLDQNYIYFAIAIAGVILAFIYMKLTEKKDTFDDQITLGDHLIKDGD